MQQSTIAFIGAGNMADAIIGGLSASAITNQHIWAADPQQENLNKLKAAYGIHTSCDNHQAISSADIVVLAVKPQVMQQVCEQIKPTIVAAQPLIISIAAGITVDALEYWLDPSLAIVRCMPNTPALVQRAATALYANQQTNEQQKTQAHDILSSIGSAHWVHDETLLDAVTAISGSGPAYFFRIIEIIQKIGEEQGLSPELSRQLTLQTALGAAEMAMQSDLDASELRRRVTSPNGTTQAALEALEACNLEDNFRQALQAANQRSKALANALTHKE